MYLFGLVTTGVGEAVIMYVLGYPLARSLARAPYFKDASPFGARVSVARHNGAAPLDAPPRLAGSCETPAIR